MSQEIKIEHNHFVRNYKTFKIGVLKFFVEKNKQVIEFKKQIKVIVADFSHIEIYKVSR